MHTRIHPAENFVGAQATPIGDGRFRPRPALSEPDIVDKVKVKSNFRLPDRHRPPPLRQAQSRLGAPGSRTLATNSDNELRDGL